MSNTQAGAHSKEGVVHRPSSSSDTSEFPDPTYRETVLAPLFEGVKTHFAASMARINRAHLVMLSDTAILKPADVSALAQALAEIEANMDIASLNYTGEHEDYFFVIEAALRERLGDQGGALHTARSRNDMDHTHRCLYARPTGTTYYIRSLPGCCDRSFVARYGAPFQCRRCAGTLPDGCCCNYNQWFSD